MKVYFFLSIENLTSGIFWFYIHSICFANFDSNRDCYDKFELRRDLGRWISIKRSLTGLVGILSVRLNSLLLYLVRWSVKTWSYEKLIRKVHIVLEIAILILLLCFMFTTWQSIGPELPQTIFISRKTVLTLIKLTFLLSSIISTSVSLINIFRFCFYPFKP